MTGQIIHAPTAHAFERARRNLVNMIAQAPDVTVELVVNGAAVSPAIGEEDHTILDHIVVCENSLSAQKLSSPSTIKTTPAAVAHIHRRQQQGWSYFRA
ncbi:MAG: hypothetical protein ACR2OW_10610 [Methyloligellaceae bacterium]